MKKILLLSLSLLITSQLFAASNSLEGEIFLNGETKKVVIKTGLLDSDHVLQVGDESFAYSGNSGKNLEGYLLVTRNGKKIKDKNIHITLGQDQLDEIKANLSELSEILANGSEVECVEESNAFIIISDNISMDMAGNCAILR